MGTTTIYIRRVINTVQEAEALPKESIVINDFGDRYNHAPRQRGGWHSAADDRDLAEDLAGVFMPPTITALVPVKVEVERLRETEGRRRAKTLYVTPWQEPAG